MSDYGPIFTHRSHHLGLLSEQRLILNGDIVSEDLPYSATASALKLLGENTAEGSEHTAADWLRISQSQLSISQSQLTIGQSQMRTSQSQQRTSQSERSKLRSELQPFHLNVI